MIRMICFNSVNEYMQHALVDGRWGNVDDAKYNSFILLKPLRHLAFTRGLRFSLADNWEERFHMVHHKFPHMSMTHYSEYVSKVSCHLVFDCDYLQYQMAVFQRDFVSLAKWWRPTHSRSDPQAKLDEALDINAKAKLIQSFTMRAYNTDEVGHWVDHPPFPHNVMILGPLQHKSE